MERQSDVGCGGPCFSEDKEHLFKRALNMSYCRMEAEAELATLKSSYTADQEKDLGD